jgi:general L-amino acid transport system permease protein
MSEGGGPYGVGAIPAEIVEATAEEDRKRPEDVRLPPREWVKENLFSSWFNTALTVVFTIVAVLFVRGLLQFIFSPDRRWDGTATNMRLLMTLNYPAEQYSRVWVSVGIIVVLAGLSAAAWNLGSAVNLRDLARRGWILAASIGIVGLLAPFSASARFWYLAVAVTLAVVCYLVVIWADAEATVNSLLVLTVGAALAVGSLWVVPYGHHAFVEGQVITESGTVAMTTKGPWTVMLLVMVAAYFVGRVLVQGLGSTLRKILGLLWIASPVVIVFFVLRDPEFDYGHIGSVEIPLFIAHAVGGGLILYFLTRPGLGEIGRIIAAVMLLAAAATFLTPMLQVIRLTCLLLAAFALAAPSFAGAPAARRRYVGAWIVTVGLMIWLVTAINTPSTVEVASAFFTGGLAITLIVAVFTLLLSFPLGVVLALARTSRMPIFRIMATTYIEFVRGIPFITVLIFFSTMLPLFLPENMEISEIAAVTIGFVLFSAAYLAENVRGGLQSVRRGQFEAADALGMTGVQRTIFIVLPQALRVSIPPLVGQAIATYKETSLLAIIGLFDLLLVARQVIPNQTEFLGSARDQLLFVSFIYWVGAYSMSRASQKLERQLGVGER